jgi:aspartyl-tRNA(Asn)/glutamyl-tRNA(Gln) amidotransferase subunit A
MADDIAFLPASELVALYRTRKLSPVEVIDETLRRLERYEAAVNAFVLYDPQTALAMARASEARWAKGEPRGLLDGVPVALKDTVEALGWPRLLGSRTLAPGTAAREDSPMTARLRAHGAVFFGKTTTPEFGWKAVTDSPLCGITRNPWDLQRSPGGSSGGSAVAVLTGLCPLAVGTDAGGSIRIPASFCGLFGLKPTFGRVAMYPGSVFGDFSQGGPLARHVADAALMLDVIKGPDARDWHSLPDDGVRYREAVYADDLKGRRVALSLSLGYHEPAPAVRQAVERAAEVFARLGAIVEPADPFAESPGPVFETLALAAFWALLRAQKPEAVALMDPGLVAAAQRGRLVSQEQYFDATVRRAALGQSLRQFFERWDLPLSPTMPIPAPYAEPRQDGAPGPDNFLTWTTYTYAFNLTKNPSASINCGLADGLPIGLMITGPLFGDAAVLQAAHAFERAAGRSWPDAELERRLAALAAPADAGVKAKIWPKTR